MNMMNFNVIMPPSYAVNDPNYEADLKAVLDPVLENLFDRTESAGWDRRKAADTVLLLAAQHVSSAGALGDRGA